MASGKVSQSDLQDVEETVSGSERGVETENYEELEVATADAAAKEEAVVVENVNTSSEFLLLRFFT